MHKLALTLGLTALLDVFLVSKLLAWLPLGNLSGYVYLLGGLAVSWALAWWITPKMVSEESPPTWMTTLLIVGAGVFIALILTRLRFYSFALMRFEPWLILLVIALGVRHLRPRMMLFVGVLAFAMQLGLVQLFGLLGAFVSLPKEAIYCLTLVAAVWVARWLCLGEESPADRVRNVGFLAFFGAAGVASLYIDAESFTFRSWTEAAIWLSFLGSFLMLANHLEPDDPTHARSALGADLLLLFMIFAALYLTSASVFRVGDSVVRTLPLSVVISRGAWLPIVICAVLAVAVIVVMKLGQRLRNDGPGRVALRWGTILLIIGALAGGSILGAGESEGRVIDLLGTLVVFAMLAGPLLIAAQFLLGVGLLRMMFHLDPPPRRD